MDTGRDELVEKFREAGFEIVEGIDASGAFILRKGGCTQRIEYDLRGSARLAGPPTFRVRGLDCRLEDHGYQKFWLHGDQRFPIRVSDLRTLHGFDEQVRQILGIPSLYHESLGTRSARSAYDRLTGRPDR